MTEIGWLMFGLGLGVLLSLGLGVLLRPKIGKIKRKIFRPSKQTLKLKEKSEGWQRLLVPICGINYPERAIQSGIELACSFGQPLYVIVFLEVPRTYSLESGMEKELEAAFDLLERVEQQGGKAGLKVITNVTKVRNYTLGLVDTVMEFQTGLIILEQTKTRMAINTTSLATQAETVQGKTGCDFLILNAPH
jgi:hypothetical protein